MNTQTPPAETVIRNASHEQQLRYDWTDDELMGLFELPFGDLLDRAHSVHKAFFDPNEVQISTLLSIKTGSCPEDCKYCPQSAHYNTGLEKETLMPLDDVVEAAKKAKEAGASRFCMGAAWRSPKDEDLETVAEMVTAVKGLGLETCVTLGMLEPHQAGRLKDAGLDYYNHNIDTSPEYYEKVISTRCFEDRLDTLSNVRDAGINVCCGGIIGMGETRADRMGMLRVLATMDPHPESVPINKLIPIPGTPLQQLGNPDPFEFVRTIAIARISIGASHVRLSAGRESMSDELQALCFFAGANSIFYGETLLTAANPVPEKDTKLFQRLGLKAV